MQYFEADTKLYAAQHQPAAIMDFAMSRDANSHLLLRGTALFIEDIIASDKRISPAEFKALLDNCQKEIHTPDTSFLIGQRLLPGFYGAVSQALQLAPNLKYAVQHLQDYHALLTPLLTLRTFENDTHFYLYWTDHIGLKTNLPFVIELYMSAIKYLVHTLSRQKYPWEYSFTYAEPKHIEQYWVHLGDEVKFDQQFNMLRIPLAWANKEWKQTTAISLPMAEHASQQQLNALANHNSFLDLVHDYLTQNIQSPLNLDTVANAFSMSPASFKRKLSKHNTSFQAQRDLASKTVALHLYQIKGYSRNAVAEYLNFTDMNNFRRSFKRWTGYLPTEIQTTI